MITLVLPYLVLVSQSIATTKSILKAVSQQRQSTNCVLLVPSQQPQSTNRVLPEPSQQPQSTSKSDSIIIGLLFLIIGITIATVG